MESQEKRQKSSFPDGENEDYEVLIIGAGSAGLAAALGAYEEGARRILLLERDNEPGGILLQCIHNGFGLHTFQEELSGPEYAERFVARLREKNIECKTRAMVTSISPDRRVTYIRPGEGITQIRAKAIVLAMGCRERTRGAIRLPGFRPAGIWTAGTAQRYINMEGYMVGRRVFILGSGDIGLIMARRMTLEGAEVLGVAELEPYSNGLPRNRKQCLEDYGIPLFLSHTITDIRGNDRLSAVVVSRVDEKRQPIPGTQKTFEVDTLLLSVGLIPENDLVVDTGVELSARTRGAVVNHSYETTVPGIFACGNVLHVHDLVDFVSEEAEKAGRAAARFAAGKMAPTDTFDVLAAEGVSYVLPQRVSKSPGTDIEFMLRVRDEFRGASICIWADGTKLRSIRRPHMAPAEMEKIRLRAPELAQISKELRFSIEKSDLPSAYTRVSREPAEDARDGEEMICIVCPVGCRLRIKRDEKGNLSVTGNSCPRGDTYARQEILTPTRMITGTVRISGARYVRLPVITSGPIPKGKIFDVMKELKNVSVTAPVTVGQVIVSGIAGLSVDMVAERSMDDIAKSERL